MNTILVNCLISAMTTEIQRYGLEVLTRYPDDLLVHDRNTLTGIAVPGITMGWAVGHSATHLSLVGIHPEQSSMLDYLASPSHSAKHFYRVAITSPTNFRMTEISRENFANMAREPVPYQLKKSDDGGGWVSHTRRALGHIAIRYEGGFQDRRWFADITPVEGATPLAHVVLETWANRAMIEKAGSLFCRTETAFLAPCRDTSALQAA